MSYIGNTPISIAFLTDTFSGNGSTTAYTMTVAPANTSSIIVAITGVLQDPSTYSVSGTTLTFSAAPPSGTSNISVRYLGIPASGVTTTAYRTVTNFTATAGQTSFSVPSYTVGYIDVYRNGVRLVSTDYTATTGTTVVLNNACTVGDAVVTESFYVSSVLNAIPNTGGSVSASNLAASGTGSSSNFLRGDMAWTSTFSRSNMPAGTILQVVSTTKTTVFSSTSSVYVDVTGLSVSITPTSATNTILILVTSSYTNSSVGQPLSINLLRNATTISQPSTSPAFFATAIPYVNQADIQVPWSLSYVDSPATTSATTYKIQAKSGGTWYVSGGRSTNDFAQTSTMIAMEIAT